MKKIPLYEKPTVSLRSLSLNFGENSNTFTLLLRFFAVIIIFGLSWPVAKLTMNSVPPLWLITYRLFFGSLCLFAYAFIRKDLVLPSRRDLPILFSGGVLLMGLFMSMSTMGLHYLTVGRSAILAYTTPLWVMPIAVLVFREQLSPSKIIGFLFGVAGLVVLLWPVLLNFHQDQHSLLGCGLLIVGAMIWAITIIHVKFTRHAFNPLRLAPWQMLIGSLISASSAFYFEPHPSIHWSAYNLLTMSYLVVSVAFCFVNMTILNRALKATTLSISILAVPIVGLLSSLFLVHEHLEIDLLIGILLIVTGIIMTLIEIDLLKIFKKRLHFRMPNADLQ